MTSRFRILAIAIAAFFIILTVVLKNYSIGILASYAISRATDGTNFSINGNCIELGSGWWLVDRSDSYGAQLAHTTSWSKDDVLFIFVKQRTVKKEEITSKEWAVRGSGELRVERADVTNININEMQIIEAIYKFSSDHDYDAEYSAIWSIPSNGVIVTVNDVDKRKLETVRTLVATIRKNSCE